MLLLEGRGLVPVQLDPRVVLGEPAVLIEENS